MLINIFDASLLPLFHVFCISAHIFYLKFWLNQIIEKWLLNPCFSHCFVIFSIEFVGFPSSSVGKESTCNSGDPGSIPQCGRTAREGIEYPRIFLGFPCVAQLVKNLPTIWETSVWSWVGKIPWRRERLPTPVFWPGEFHGLYSPWGHKESDMTERLSHRNFNRNFT